MSNRTCNRNSTDQSLAFFAWTPAGAPLSAVPGTAGLTLGYQVATSGRWGNTVSLTPVNRSAPGVHTDGAITLIDAATGEHVVDLPDAATATDKSQVRVVVTITAEAEIHSSVLSVGQATVVVDSLSATAQAQIVTASAAARETKVLPECDCIPVTEASDWLIPFTAVGDLTSRSNVLFAIKTNGSDVDNDALVLVSETGGLLRNKGAAALDATLASITVTDATAGTGTILVKAAATAGIASGPKSAALKAIFSTGTVRVATLWKPCVTVQDGVVDAIV